MDLTSPHGTAGSLAYSQLGFLPFLQLASVTGPWGMSFLLLSFSTALAIGLRVYPEAPRRAGKLMGITAAVLVLVLGLGAWRLHEPVQGPKVKVGLVSSDTPENADVADEGAPTARLFQDYSVPIGQLASQGAQVVVLPEKLGVVLDANIQDTDGYFQKLTDRTGAALVVGVIRVALNERLQVRAVRWIGYMEYPPGASPSSKGIAQDLHREMVRTLNRGDLDLDVNVQTASVSPCFFARAARVAF